MNRAFRIAACLLLCSCAELARSGSVWRSRDGCDHVGLRGHTDLTGAALTAQWSTCRVP